VLTPRLVTIKETMAHWRLSQHQVARASGVSQAHISCLFSAKYQPGDVTLRKLERAVAELVKGAKRSASALRRAR
jgi:predicted transcriptional regulator